MYMGVVLHTHLVYGELHIQCNANIGCNSYRAMHCMEQDREIALINHRCSGNWVYKHSVQNNSFNDVTDTTT